MDLAIFNAGRAHDEDELIRFIIVAKDAKVKPTDKKAGVEATTENILSTTDCEFACWTNGEDLQYVHAFEDDFGQVTCEPISDFPAEGQTLEDLENREKELCHVNLPMNRLSRPLSVVMIISMVTRV